MFEDTLDLPTQPTQPTQHSTEPTLSSSMHPVLLYLNIVVIVIVGSILYSVYRHYFEHSHLKKDIHQLESQFEHSLSESESSSK